jgi:hypothetical protein
MILKVCISILFGSTTNLMEKSGVRYYFNLVDSPKAQ